MNRSFPHKCMLWVQLSFARGMQYSMVPAKILHRGIFHFHFHCHCRRWTKKSPSGQVVLYPSRLIHVKVLQLLTIRGFIPQLESHPTKSCDKNFDSCSARNYYFHTTTTTTVLALLLLLFILSCPLSS